MRIGPGLLTFFCSSISVHNSKPRTEPRTEPRTKPRTLQLLRCCLACVILFTCLTQVCVCADPGTEIYVKFDREVRIVKSNDNLQSESTFPAQRPDLQALLKTLRPISVEPAFKLKDQRLKNIWHLRFETTKAADSAVETLNRLEYTLYAEIIPEYQLLETPNDLDGQQWSLTEIRAPAAWDISRGRREVRVAVVDDGVLLTHEDLRDVIWTNPNEIPDNGIDDDQNGYIDDVRGWDAAENDNDASPRPGMPAAEYAHGTHCSGIVGAATNNSSGVASIGYGVSIVPVKASHDNAPPKRATSGPAGVEYAIAADVDVISMSWGSFSHSQTVDLLMQAAHARGIVLVAAAGNSSSAAPYYPAAYDNVIGVGATHRGGRRAEFSNYGDHIDVMAPGVNIYSCIILGSGYGKKSGTSMACPLVAGLAALLISYVDGITPEEVLECLKNSATPIDDLNPGFEGQLGAGKIDAFRTLSCLDVEPTAGFEADKLTVCPNGIVQFTDFSRGNRISEYNWQFPGGVPSSSQAVNPKVRYPNPGRYSVNLTVVNAFGQDVISKTDYIEVTHPTANMQQEGSVVRGIGAVLRVDLSGAPPWTIRYSDGTREISIPNIVNTPYYFRVNPRKDTRYTLLAVEDADCVGEAEGRVRIEIDEDAELPIGGFNRIYGDAQDNSIGRLDFNPLQNNYVWVDRTLTRQVDIGILDGNSGRPLTRTTVDSDMLPTAVKMQDDGSLIVSGINNYDGGGRNLGIFKLSADAQLEWMFEFRQFDREIQCEMSASNNGAVILSSARIVNQTANDLVFIKLEADGTIAWTRQLDLGGDEIIEAVIATPGGGQIFAGANNINERTMFLGELSADGEVLWVRPVDVLPNKLESGAGLALLAGGDIILVASEWQELTSYIARLDRSGHLIWANVFTRRAETNIKLGNPIFSVDVDIFDNIYLVYSKAFRTGIIDPNIMKFSSAGNFRVGYDYGIWSVNKLLSHGDAITIAGFDDRNPRGFGRYDQFVARLPTDLLNCMAVPEHLEVRQIGDTSTQAWPAMRYELVPSEMLAHGLQPQVIPQAPLASLDLCCELSPELQVEPSGPICIGTTVRVRADGLDADANVEWALDGRTLGQGATSEYVFNKSGVFKLTAAVDNGLCASLLTAKIEVRPPLDIAVAPPDSLCADESYRLEARGADTFIWTPADGLSCSDCPDPVLLPLNSTSATTRTYSVRGWDDDGCTGVTTVTLAIYRCCDGQLPQQLTIGVDKNVICPGEAFVFESETELPESTQYAWDFGPAADPPISRERRVQVRFAQPGTYPVRLTVTNDCGVEQAAERRVYIVPLPRAYAGEDFEACASGSLNRQLGEPGLEHLIYRWEPAEFLTNPDIADPVATIRERTRFSLTVTDPISGCVAVDAVEIGRRESLSALEILSGTTMDFGLLGSGRAHCLPVRLRNSSQSESLSLLEGKLLHNVEFSVPSSQFPLNLAPGAAAEILLCFSAAAIDEYVDTLRFKSDCGDLDVALRAARSLASFSGLSNCGINLNGFEQGLYQSGLAIGVPWPNPTRESVNITLLHLPSILDIQPNVKLFNSFGVAVAADVTVRAPFEVEHAKFNSAGAAQDVLLRTDVEVRLEDLAAGIYYLQLDGMGARRSLPFVRLR